MMGQGFRQPSGVDQGGNSWYDPNYDKPTESYVDKEREKDIEILTPRAVSGIVERWTKKK